MRILHVITKADYGGAQTVVFELAQWQLEKGHTVALVTGEIGRISDRLQSIGVDVTHLSSFIHPPAWSQDRLAVKELGARIDSFRPDIVHTHSSKGGLLGRIATRPRKLPTVYTAHGWPFQPGAAPKQRLQSFVAEFLGGHWHGEIVCVSRHDFDRANRIRLASKRRIHYIANGVSPARHRATPGQPSDVPLRIVMAARFDSPKRVDLAIAAVAQCRNTKLLLVGDGPDEPAIRALVAASGAQDRITLVGPTNDVESVLAGADVSLHLSNYEGLSISMLEALRSGVVIVANDLPGAHEALGDTHTSDHPCGVIVEKEADAIASVLRRLEADRPNLATIGARAEQRFELLFRADAMCLAYQQLYERLHSSRGPSTL
jgi:glycosyltransferase involved in cell wall biosynthesis